MTPDTCKKDKKDPFRIDLKSVALGLLNYTCAFGNATGFASFPFVLLYHQQRKLAVKNRSDP